MGFAFCEVGEGRGFALISRNGGAACDLCSLEMVFGGVGRGSLGRRGVDLREQGVWSALEGGSDVPSGIRGRASRQLEETDLYEFESTMSILLRMVWDGLD